MTFIDQLLKGGRHYIAERKTGSASFRPKGSAAADLERFQPVVKQIYESAGDGYSVFKDHASSDRPGNPVDLIILTLDD
jgi:hypothetical protein